jgi:hypothetical protein
MPSAILDEPRRPRANSTFIAGSILLGITFLAVVAMAHHPRGVATSDVEHAMEHLAGLSRATAVVHGGLIASMLLTLHCLAEFASHRGFARPLIRSGAIAYTAGVLVMIGAALVSGFVTPNVASLMPHDTPVDLQVGRQLLILCGILNQACADSGAVAMSVGIALWSLDLLRDRGPSRAIGSFGLLVGIVPIVALLTGAIRLDVRGMFDVVLLQAAWYLAIAALLLRAGR